MTYCYSWRSNSLKLYFKRRSFHYCQEFPIFRDFIKSICLSLARSITNRFILVNFHVLWFRKIALHICTYNITLYIPCVHLISAFTCHHFNHQDLLTQNLKSRKRKLYEFWDTDFNVFRNFGILGALLVPWISRITSLILMFFWYIFQNPFRFWRYCGLNIFFFKFNISRSRVFQGFHVPSFSRYWSRNIFVPETRSVLALNFLEFSCLYRSLFLSFFENIPHSAISRECLIIRSGATCAMISPGRYILLSILLRSVRWRNVSYVSACL